MLTTVWHPNTQHGLMPQSIEIESAQGAYLRTVDGRDILDAISSWWVITHGHCHPKIVEAVRMQAARLEQVIFAGFTHNSAEELAERLMAVTPKALSHVFYSDSGSTAVEVAMKMAAGYWAHQGRPRTRFLALEGGYHGDTFGTMAVGAPSAYNSVYRPFLFDVARIPVPVAGKEAESFAALEDYLRVHGGDTAAFLFEPLVQGAGGMRMYSPEALRTLCEMCRKYGVLLVADEVMAGFGRLGGLFACDQAGVVPDLMALSKGLTGGFLPMGATLATEDIYQSFYSTDRGRQFFHSTSFTGNALACTAACASLKIWEEEDVLGRVRDVSSWQAQGLERLSRHRGVSNVRSCGTILAMDVLGDGEGYLSSLQPQLYSAFLAQDVLLRPIGNTVYILPPYCVTQSDLDKAYSAIERAVSELSEG
ncbi:MAG: adenosylmethionine--8-amino-7-oxononanoate transaminase [Alphaproteobacteria bacterium]|nr:adenosylmethionine--8-amino-7-oxononanoate transaminase [Alphaproteobacteria bacterium]